MTSQVLAELFSNSPRVIIMGSSTWGQGSNRYIRQLFETLPPQSIIGTQASSWVDCWRSAHWCGSGRTRHPALAYGYRRSVFNLGQKIVVFTTEERVDIPPGEFTVLVRLGDGSICAAHNSASFATSRTWFTQPGESTGNTGLSH